MKKNDKTTNAAGRPAVIAISRQAATMQAVMLGRTADELELLWTKSCPADEVTPQSFTADLDSETTIVAGFDSAPVIFYRIEIPPVKGEEVAAIVRLQAEARLPLPADQMQLTWRPSPARMGQVAVTIAAAKTSNLQEFVDDVQKFNPERIFLECEAVVKAWQKFFGGTEQSAVIVSIGTYTTKVCLAEDGKLSNAASLDLGTEDLGPDQSQTAERFAQDLKSVLNLFDCNHKVDIPVIILTDGNETIEELMSSLTYAGLNVQTAAPKSHLAEPRQIYEYRTCLGLALMSLDGDAGTLNIFEHLYIPSKKKEKTRLLSSPRTTAGVGLAILLIFVFIFYLADCMSLRGIEKRLARAGTEMKCDVLGRQKLVKTIAKQRPDILKLMNDLKTDGSDGILLDSLNFNKGRKITISGQSPSEEQLYKFQKSLDELKSIRQVKLQNATKDEKGGKFKFTITFHYRNFTSKRA